MESHFENIKISSDILIVTFPAETAAPTEAKSVLAIFFVQNPQERAALQQREHRFDTTVE